MFKVGDIVEITEESDAAGMLDFIKGKGYPVLDWSNQPSSGGYTTVYIQQIRLKDESGRVGWYGSGFFKLKEKEEKKVETLFKKGQVVWDVVYGKGVVVEIVERSTYPVVVQFSDETMAYTVDGKTYETHGRTLFFSEPKIEAATEPVFEPVLNKGDWVVLSDATAEAIVKVEKETRTELFYDAGGAITFVNKDCVSVYRLGEKIMFN